MRKAIACLGDSTTTGGKIIHASSTMYDDQKPIALSGDEATCGKCKGVFKIIGTGEGILECGRMAVVHGDFLLCPCKKNRIVSSLNAGYFILDDGESSANYSQRHDLARGGTHDREQLFDEQFQLIDRYSDMPCADTEYAIVRQNGVVEYGRTDSEGYTHTISATSTAEIVEIYM